VSGGANIETQTLEVSFLVKPVPEYGIELGQTGTLLFEDAILGYAALTPHPISVRNRGNQETGALTIGVTGADFTLSKTAIANIAVDGETEFTVVPKTGLAAADAPYTATVTVSGGHDITAAFEVSFTVTATYGITLNPTAHTFPEAIFNYGAQEVKTVTIRNTGNQPTGPLTVDAGADFEVTAPANGAVDSIAVNGTETFSVRPKTGLAAGLHSATVTVSGGTGTSAISAEFDVSFVVIGAVYGITLNQTSGYIFPDAILGYPAQAVKTVTISNTGNQPTGALTVSAGTDFEVTAPVNGTVSSIPVGDAATFSVRPKTGLAKGAHTATVTVSGGTGTSAVSASFGVSFTVTATYGISLSKTGTYPFPDAIAGYAALTPQSVTITNTGNQPTGDLAIALAGAGAAAFTLSASSAASIGVGDIGTFTVTPATGRTAGSYTATVTVSGTNNITASFGVTFTVTATYGIALSGNGGSLAANYTHPFGTVTPPNYTLPTALSVTVTNTGDQSTGALNVALAGAGAAAFTLSATTVASIAAGLTGSFTVAPSAGQEAGDYTATVTVSGGNGITASFGVSFAVTAVYSVALSSGGTAIGTNYTHQFDKVTLPSYFLSIPSTPSYTAPAPLSVTLTNTGNKPTGALTVALAGAGAAAFTLSSSSVASIAAGGTATFTVGPIAGITAQDVYTATVAVSGGNGISASFAVSFEVDATPTWVSSFSALVTQMKKDNYKGQGYYNLQGGLDTYSSDKTLEFATCPANAIIDGNGRIVRGGGKTLSIGAGVTVTLRNITFERFQLNVNYGGKLVLDTGAVVQGISKPGVIVGSSHSLGTLEMKEGSIVRDNGSALGSTNGGGVVINGGTFTMYGGEISGNTGGGVRIEGTGTIFTMNGGTISGNTDNGVSLNNAVGFTMSGGTISANTGSGVNIKVGTFTMNEGTISGNTGNTGGGVRIEGGIFTMNGGTISGNMTSGGVRIAGGTFTMEGGTISGNYCPTGGGVRIEGQGCVFTMNGGLISGNTAGQGTTGGGGVVLYGANTVFNMNGGAISDNSSTYQGGGVALLGDRAKFNMSGGVISGNRIEWNEGAGGGVFSKSSASELTMGGGTISGNSASYGGGVALCHYKNMTFKITGGLITDNSVTNNGGGVYVMSGNTLNMIGGEITGNIASVAGGGVHRVTADSGFTGNPQIGGTTAPASGGWVHGNTPHDLYAE
jgi:uncharacterized membrane protein